MANMLILRSRAEQLRRLGLSSHRAFRVLRNEFPNAERDMLVNAAGLPGAHSGVNPWWTTWGRSLRPTQIRFQNKGRPRKEEPVVVRTVGEELKPEKRSRSDEKLERLVVLVMQQAEEANAMFTGAPTMKVQVKKVFGGDWIEGIGEVAAVTPVKGGKVYVLLESGDSRFLLAEDYVEIRLEDLAEDLEEETEGE